MIRGLYTAGAGMMVQMAKQDVVANNIANVNTSGYKKDNVLCQSFPSMLISRLGESQYDALGQEKLLPPVVIGPLGTGAVVKDIVTDHSSGSLKFTGNLTDLAISNEGFYLNGSVIENADQRIRESYFVVQTPQGERFTRDGSFKINQEGILQTNQGVPVMSSEDEAISILNDDGQVADDFTVDKNGIILVNNQEIARLKIVNFAEQRNLEKEGAWMRAKAGEYTVVENPGIMQGYLEMSNANAVSEMVTLISVVRAYESCQKVVQAEDELMSVAIDQVGSVK